MSKINDAILKFTSTTNKRRNKMPNRMKTFVMPPFSNEKFRDDLIRFWEKVSDVVVVDGNEDGWEWTSRATYNGFLKFLFKKHNLKKQDCANLVYEEFPSPRQFKELIKQKPCKMQIYIGDANGDGAFFHHDGKQLVD